MCTANLSNVLPKNRRMERVRRSSVRGRSLSGLATALGLPQRPQVAHRRGIDDDDLGAPLEPNEASGGELRRDARQRLVDDDRIVLREDDARFVGHPPSLSPLAPRSSAGSHRSAPDVLHTRPVAPKCDMEEGTMSRLSVSASRAARAFSVRTILIGVICLSVGGGLAKAAPPIDIFQLADGTNTTQLAKVDAAGNIAVSVSNLPATQTVAGTVAVSNGTVAVSNLPATQNVAGSVAVSNLPATQNVAGAVAVSNFPATQQIAGSVGDARVTTQIALDDLTLDAGCVAASGFDS